MMTLCHPELIYQYDDYLNMTTAMMFTNYDFYDYYLTLTTITSTKLETWTECNG